MLVIDKRVMSLNLVKSNSKNPLLNLRLLRKEDMRSMEKLQPILENLELFSLKPKVTLLKLNFLEELTKLSWNMMNSRA